MNIYLIYSTTGLYLGTVNCRSERQAKRIAAADYGAAIYVCTK